MLRSRFESLPGAFNARLIPVDKSEPKKKGLKATLSRTFGQVKVLLSVWGICVYVTFPYCGLICVSILTGGR